MGKMPRPQYGHSVMLLNLQMWDGGDESVPLSVEPRGKEVNIWARVNSLENH